MFEWWQKCQGADNSRRSDVVFCRSADQAADAARTREYALEDEQIVEELEAGGDPEATADDAELGDANPYCSPFYCFGTGGGWGVTGR
jgi:hypothetical protein